MAASTLERIIVESNIVSTNGALRRNEIIPALMKKNTTNGSTSAKS